MTFFCVKFDMSLASSFNRMLVMDVGRSIASARRAALITVLIGPLSGLNGNSGFGEDVYLASNLTECYLHCTQEMDGLSSNAAIASFLDSFEPESSLTFNNFEKAALVSNCKIQLYSTLFVRLFVLWITWYVDTKQRKRFDASIFKF